MPAKPRLPSPPDSLGRGRWWNKARPRTLAQVRPAPEKIAATLADQFGRAAAACAHYSCFESLLFIHSLIQSLSHPITQSLNDHARASAGATTLPPKRPLPPTRRCPLHS